MTFSIQCSIIAKLLTLEAMSSTLQHNDFPAVEFDEQISFIPHPNQMAQCA